MKLTKLKKRKSIVKSLKPSIVIFITFVVGFIILNAIWYFIFYIPSEEVLNVMKFEFIVTFLLTILNFMASMYYEIIEIKR